MSDRTRIIVKHMLQAIAHIHEDTQHGAYMTFATDRQLRQLVERNLEIISEASRRLPDTCKQAHPQIPWRQIADIGNVLRHEYDQIDETELRLVVERDLEPLEKALKAIEQSLNSDDTPRG